MRSTPSQPLASTTLAALALLAGSARADAQAVLTNHSDKTLVFHPELSHLKGTVLLDSFDPLHPEAGEDRQGVELMDTLPTSFIKVGPGKALRLAFNVDARNPSLGYKVSVLSPSAAFLFEFSLVHQVNSLKEPREESLYAAGLGEVADYPHTLKQVAPGEYVFDKVQVEGKAEPALVQKSLTCVIL